MMSGQGANPIFFNKKNKDWTSKTRVTPHLLRPITSYFCLTPPPPPQLPLRVDVICVSPLTGHNDCKSAITKSDLSDHFPIVFALKTNETAQKSVVKFTYKRSYRKKKILKNLKILCTTETGMALKKIGDSSKAYKYFLDIINFYDKSYPKTEVKLKKKDQSHWITKQRRM